MKKKKIRKNLDLASSVRQKFISFVVLTVVGGGGWGAGWGWAVGNKLCLTWLDKQSVMMNSFHQTE